MLDALFSAISHPCTLQAMRSGDVAKTIYVVTSILIVALWVVVIGGGK